MTMVWQSSRRKAISLSIEAYIIMTVMVRSCTVILKNLPKYSMERAFPESLG